jgi:hypothetical protein
LRSRTVSVVNDKSNNSPAAIAGRVRAGGGKTTFLPFLTVVAGEVCAGDSVLIYEKFVIFCGLPSCKISKSEISKSLNLIAVFIGYNRVELDEFSGDFNDIVFVITRRRLNGLRGSCGEKEKKAEK